MMRLFFHIGILSLFFFIQHSADLYADDSSITTSDILIRAEVTPEEDIVVGQRVILLVDVLAFDGWAQVKRVRDFSVEGTQVVRYESQGTRLNETIQGRAFAGQRYQLSLFPRREGIITVPSIPVEVEVSRWGSKNGKESKRVKTPEISFKVQVPPEAEGVPGLISTPRLTATEKWEPEQQKFKVGEAIKRTIKLVGQDISGMAFTPLQFKSNEMVSVYPSEPRVDDSFDRGTLTGQRVETVTYVFTGEGTIELPEIAIDWWDMDKKELQRVVLPTLQLEISPSPMPAKRETESATIKGQARSLWQWAAIALVFFLGVLLILAAFYRNHIQSVWARWQQCRSERENFYFKQFVEATRSNDPKAAFNSLMRWLDQIHTSPGAARLDEFIQNYGDKMAIIEVDLLEQVLSKENSHWSGRALAASMSVARRRWKKAQLAEEAGMGLPPLNP